MRAQVRARNGALDGWRFGVLIGALIQCLPSAAVAQATPTEPAQPSPKLSARAAVPAPAPTPTAKVLDLAARLGAIDSAAQHIVSAPTGTRMMQESDFIAARWPGVRSALVQAGAKRADLLIADGALRNLRTPSRLPSPHCIRLPETGCRRASTGLTTCCVQSVLMPLKVIGSEQPLMSYRFGQRGKRREVESLITAETARHLASIEQSGRWMTRSALAIRRERRLRLRQPIRISQRSRRSSTVRTRHGGDSSTNTSACSVRARVHDR
jgi:hypothetical protein